MQCIFSRISCRASDARTFHVSEKMNHNRTNKINWYVCENLTARKCLLGLDTRKNIYAYTTQIWAFLGFSDSEVGSRILSLSIANVTSVELEEPIYLEFNRNKVSLFPFLSL